MKKHITAVLCAAAVGAVLVANAAWVSEEDATKAATAFVTTDAVGKIVLAGREVSAVTQRGNLWVAALSPSGHVLLSRSDLSDPIVGFSATDFTEPDPASPAYSVLERASDSAAALEAQGGTRHARWSKFLVGGKIIRTLAADVESPSTVVVQPFLTSQYDQCQPYNDYAPVHEASTNNLDYYRGRCPCGCVATAAVQGFRHFRWPARIDRVDSFNHDFTDANNLVTSFPLRFDGNIPLDWDELADTYPSDAGGEWIPDPDRPGTGWLIWKSFPDMRGTVPEAVRYPVARLVLFADVLARMSFTPGWSGAHYDTVASNAQEWYTIGTWVSATDPRVLSDISNGVPVQIGIPDHAVVGHGWANDDENTYIYLNYGWGGSNDGYYNINGSTIEEVYVGHYPRARPQLDPLPAVSGSNLTLNWHFPDFYTNKLSGFTVTAKKTATTPSTFLDDFSASEGISSSSDIYVQNSGNSQRLYSDYSAKGSYTYSKNFILTAASELTFKVSSYAAVSSTLEIQAKFNDDEWQTIAKSDLDEGFGNASWMVHRAYLGEHGGEAVQFRIVRNWGGVYYIDKNGNRVDYGYVLLDDFQVTEVLAPTAPNTYNVDKTSRSLPLSGLEAGADYSFTVKANVSGALVDGETSAPATTTIAGTRNVPVPGEQTYSSHDLVFSTSDTSGVWSYSGTAVDDESVSGGWNCSIGCLLPGEMATGAVLSFDWTANDYYGASSYDILSARFNTSDGEECIVWCYTNTSAKTSKQHVSCDLAQLCGQIGRITISYSHNGGGYGSGGVIYSPQITNVLVPSVPAVAWETETLTALGTPQIRTVSAVEEGFYGECGTNTSAFTVICSSSVESLDARPSHLSLVRDEDVTVTKTGSGTFNVSIEPSGVNEGNLRSRMILTLVGTDSNGTKCYKDLSLRFSEVEQVVSDVVVSASTSGGDAYSVVVPYSWIEESGLAASGSDAAAYKAALASTADADGDGLPNWAEFVCGTSPTNAEDKLTISIAMVNGEPIVEYSNTKIAGGFEAVLKGTTDISTAAANWEVVTETTTSTHRFFRVEIVPEE